MHRLEQSSPGFSTSIQPALVTPPAQEAGSIENYVQLGLARNPAVAEARHRIESLRHRIPQELSLPDPRVNTTTHLSPVETAAGRQAFALGVSQKFVNSQRLATKAAIALEDVRAAEQELNVVQLEVAEKIRVACYQLLYIRSAIELTLEDVESLEQIGEVVLRQYEVKQSVSQQDVLNVQIEQSKVENQLVGLRQKEHSFQARLARLVHLRPGSELQINDELSLAWGPLDVDTLIAQAIATRPELAAQIANIRRERKKVHLANLQNIPDFTVGLNWIATSSDGVSPVANGDDALLLGIGFNLPVRKTRIRAAICEANASSLASESRLEILQDEVAEDVFDLVARADGTAETLQLLQEDIIPKSERSLELSIDEYANGDVKYVQLIENWRSLLKYRITVARLISEYNQTIASLVRSTGEQTPVANIDGFARVPEDGIKDGIKDGFEDGIPTESNSQDALDEAGRESEASPDRLINDPDKPAETKPAERKPVSDNGEE